MNESATRVLVVEDDDAQCQVIRRAFDGNAEFSLEVAGDLQSAELTLSQFAPHIVFADLRLPDGKGTQLIAQAKACESAPPVIVMTSFGNEAIAVDAIKQGALDYAVKTPGLLSDLPQYARRCLREWEQTRKRREAEKTSQQLMAVVEATTDLVALCGVEGNLRYLNSAGLRMTGLEGEPQISDRRLADFLPPHEQAQFRHVALPYALKHGQWHGEITMYSAANPGEPIPVSLSILSHLDVDGNVEFLSVIARDVSLQKHEAIRESMREEAKAKLSVLTRRENDVLALIVGGTTNKAVARYLELSEKTIEKHRANLMRKLELQSVAELVQLAMTAGVEAHRPEGLLPRRRDRSAPPSSSTASTPG